MFTLCIELNETMAACPIQPGKTYRVNGFLPHCDSAYRHKLLSLGFVPGTTFEALRVAPFGDPVQVRIRGFLLSLRIKECECLVFEEVQNDAHR